MAPEYKLTYFPIMAVAEPARFLMSYGGIEFEDDRIVREQWPQIKTGMPFGQLPTLTVNGKQFHQSLAINRYLAKQVKLVGKDDLEALEIDSVVETVNDLRTKIAQYSYEQDAAIKESRKGPLFNDTLPYYMERLDEIAKKNNGHLACKKLTWADMFFVAILEYMNYMAGMDILAKYENLSVVKKNVLALPAIQSWVEKRPKTDM